MNLAPIIWFALGTDGGVSPTPPPPPSFADNVIDYFGNLVVDYSGNQVVAVPPSFFREISCKISN